MLNAFQAYFGIFFCFILMFVHELGHYIWAKKEGIYKGWGILPNPHIKLTHPFARRVGYLSGFASSWLLVPMWLYVYPLNLFWMFIILTCAAASIDFIIFVGYGRLKKNA